eukprot:3655389-Pleurochrysis_carterae.AAC.2
MTNSLQTGDRQSACVLKPYSSDSVRCTCMHVTVLALASARRSAHSRSAGQPQAAPHRRGAPLPTARPKAPARNSQS